MSATITPITQDGVAITWPVDEVAIRVEHGKVTVEHPHVRSLAEEICNALNAGELSSLIDSLTGGES